MSDPKLFDPKHKWPVRGDRAGKRAETRGGHEGRGAWAGVAPAAWLLALFAAGPAAVAQTQNPVVEANPTPMLASKPRQAPGPERVTARLPEAPRVLEAQRFLRERGWQPGQRMIPRAGTARAFGAYAGVAAMGAPGTGGTGTGDTPFANAASANTWQPLGPSAVQTPDFGLVTGRVAAIALDPSDPTGNRLYLGTTGGGVWVANNAGRFDAVFDRLYSAHRRGGGSRRRRGRLHQHWRADACSRAGPA